MSPDFHLVLSPEYFSQAAIAFGAVSIVVLLVLFLHTAASDWLRLSRAERRARRIERRIKDQVSES